jgi:23S rRNA (adenine2503-C2)-methyltransferase
MDVIKYTGEDDLATVYLGRFEHGKLVEFVESVQPPLPREQKWVLIISTLFGCPVRCQMCDAGNDYKGKMSSEEIFAQIDYLVDKRYPGRKVTTKMFKIQFARMGDPSLNHAVLDCLEQFHDRYDAPTFVPSLSTVAPLKTEKWFERLLDVRTLYGPNFQMQFSIHTTNLEQRIKLIPVPKWSFDEIAAFGERFYKDGDRKIGLNFALADGSEISPQVLTAHFDPSRYVIKVTPLNPTYRASTNNLATYIDPSRPDGDYPIIERVREAGYEVILNIGDQSENQIGSNCGQYVSRYLQAEQELERGYDRELVEVERLTSTA